MLGADGDRVVVVSEEVRYTRDRAGRVKRVRGRRVVEAPAGSTASLGAYRSAPVGGKGREEEDRILQGDALRGRKAGDGVSLRDSVVETKSLSEGSEAPLLAEIEVERGEGLMEAVLRYADGEWEEGEGKCGCILHSPERYV